MAVVAETCSRVNVMYAGRIVESSETAALFERPAHPYTRALLSSIIRIDDDVRRLNTIPGLMPDLIDVPAGCAFHPRCPEAFAPCNRVQPALLEMVESRFAACHLVEAHGGAD